MPEFGCLDLAHSGLDNQACTMTGG